MVENNNCNFTLGHYEYIIKKALAEDYTISKLEDYEKNIKKNKVLFFRHDVDFDTNLALRFAKREHKLGIETTYFLRTRASYNLFSYQNCRNLRDIMLMNHEIGLHHEGGFSIAFGEIEETTIRTGKKILETATGRKINGIASHEAGRSKLNAAIDPVLLKKLGFLYDAYSPLFTKDIKYISDSSANWREGCMCNFINSSVNKLCILTHPIWWYEKSSVENY